MSTHAVAKAPPTNRPPRSTQGRRLLGPATLRSYPFASQHSQVWACLGPGGYCRRSGTGVPRLACLRPAVWLERGPSAAHLHQHKLKTLARGQASRGGWQKASSGTASSGWLARRRRDQGGVPHKVPVTQAMTTKARRALACAESLFPLWCKGSKRRQEYQAKATILVQQDQDQQNGRMEVIMEPKPASPPEPLTGEDQL